MGCGCRKSVKVKSPAPPDAQVASAVQKGPALWTGEPKPEPEPAK